MKNLHPIGIPNSIFLESLFAKTFDASKLEEDAERVRDAMQQHGYFKAVVDDPKTQLRDVNKTFRIPFVQSGKGTPVPDGSPIVIGPDVTHIQYLAQAVRCWVRASFVTQAFS